MTVATQIYFAEAPDQIKIGISRNPSARLVQLSRECGGVPLRLIGTIKGNMDREQAIHKSLSAFRIKGEWYRDCPETRASIQNCFNNFDAADERRALPTNNFGLAWKAIFPFKAAEELAARTGCSIRNANYQMAGGRSPTARSLAVLLDEITKHV